MRLPGKSPKDNKNGPGRLSMESLLQTITASSKSSAPNAPVAKVASGSRAPSISQLATVPEAAAEAAAAPLTSPRTAPDSPRWFAAAAAARPATATQQLHNRGVPGMLPPVDLGLSVANELLGLHSQAAAAGAALAKSTQLVEHLHQENTTLKSDLEQLQRSHTALTEELGRSKAKLSQRSIEMLFQEQQLQAAHQQAEAQAQQAQLHEQAANAASEVYDALCLRLMVVVVKAAVAQEEMEKAIRDTTQNECRLALQLGLEVLQPLQAFKDAWRVQLHSPHSSKRSSVFAPGAHPDGTAAAMAAAAAAAAASPTKSAASAAAGPSLRLTSGIGKFPRTSSINLEAGANSRNYGPSHSGGEGGSLSRERSRSSSPVAPVLSTTRSASFRPSSVLDLQRPSVLGVFSPGESSVATGQQLAALRKQLEQLRRLRASDDDRHVNSTPENNSIHQHSRGAPPSRHSASSSRSTSPSLTRSRSGSPVDVLRSRSACSSRDVNVLTAAANMLSEQQRQLREFLDVALASTTGNRPHSCSSAIVPEGQPPAAARCNNIGGSITQLQRRASISPRNPQPAWGSRAAQLMGPWQAPPARRSCSAGHSVTTSPARRASTHELLPFVPL